MSFDREVIADLAAKLKTIHPELTMVNLSQLFDFSNLFVLPFWALMIILPGWGITKKVMASYIPFVVLAGLYIYLFAISIEPGSAQALASPDLATITHFFGTEKAAATGWTHFLVLDLFVGRWVYWQGQQTKIWTTHSLILCLFAGPIGLLSHLLTTWSVKLFRKDLPSETATPAISSTGDR